METIDTSADTPFPHDWATVGSTRKYGTVKLSSLRLYEPEGRTLAEVEREVRDMDPANMAVLQYIHGNPDSVPEEWREYRLFFFGTKLRDREGCWCVPSGRWDSSAWDRGAGWLTDQWRSSSRVVLLGDPGDLNPAPLGPGLPALVARVEKIEALLNSWRMEDTPQRNQP